jgi:hypothetical protein
LTEQSNKLQGVNNWYTMPLVVLTGIPIYSYSASVAPVAIALVDKGMPLGTAGVYHDCSRVIASRIYYVEKSAYNTALAHFCRYFVHRYLTGGLFV